MFRLYKNSKDRPDFKNCLNILYKTHISIYNVNINQILYQD